MRGPSRCVRFLVAGLVVAVLVSGCSLESSARKEQRAQQVADALDTAELASNYAIFEMAYKHDITLAHSTDAKLAVPAQAFVDATTAYNNTFSGDNQFLDKDGHVKAVLNGEAANNLNLLIRGDLEGVPSAVGNALFHPTYFAWDVNQVLADRHKPAASSQAKRLAQAFDDWQNATNLSLFKQTYETSLAEQTSTDPNIAKPAKRFVDAVTAFNASIPNVADRILDDQGQFMKLVNRSDEDNLPSKLTPTVTDNALRLITGHTPPGFDSIVSDTLTPFRTSMKYRFDQYQALRTTTTVP